MSAIIIFGAKYLVFLLILFAAVYVLFQNKSKRQEIAIFSAVVLPLAYALAKISSFFYYNPRPFVVGPPAGGFVSLISHVADNGFPSDHTLLASAVAMSIFCFNKKMGTFLFALAFLVGFSRVLAGVHHGLDIFGSFMVSIIAYCLANKWIVPKIRNKIKML